MKKFLSRFEFRFETILFFGVGLNKSYKHIVLVVLCFGIIFNYGELD